MSTGFGAARRSRISLKLGIAPARSTAARASAHHPSVDRAVKTRENLVPVSDNAALSRASSGILIVSA